MKCLFEGTTLKGGNHVCSIWLCKVANFALSSAKIAIYLEGTVFLVSGQSQSTLEVVSNRQASLPGDKKMKLFGAHESHAAYHCELNLTSK